MKNRASLPFFHFGVLTGVAPRLRRDERRRGVAIAKDCLCPQPTIQEIYCEKLNVWKCLTGGDDSITVDEAMEDEDED